jgi:hypothetical protein
MYALVHHDVRQVDTSGQHLYSYFPGLRFGAVLFNDLKGISPTIVSHDDACVFHGVLPRLRGTATGY